MQVRTFEFDLTKSNANRDKHGIDFELAQALWADELHIIVPAKNLGEERQAIIGKLQDKIWIAIFTPRGSAIRLISVRRARQIEIENYEKANRRRIGQEI